MPTFDVHQHLWPSELIAELKRRKAPPCLRGATLVLGEGEFGFDAADHEPERRIAAMDRAGIEVAVLSLQPTLGVEALGAPEREELLGAWHEGVAALVDRNGGRFRALASGVALDEFAGACIPASTVLTGGEAFDRLLAGLTRNRGVLFVHPGPATPRSDVPSWWAAAADYTSQMQAAYLAWLCRSAGEVRPPVVFALLAGGGPFQLERIACRGGDARLALDPRVFFDVSSYGPRALELCVSAVGVGQLLYGSDAPVIDPETTLQAVRSLGDAVSTAMCDDNPTLLFG